MKTSNIKIIVLVALLFSIQVTYAYDDTGDDGQLLDSGIFENAASTSNPDAPGGDPGVAPIDDYLPLLLLAGITLGYVYTRKRRTV